MLVKARLVGSICVSTRIGSGERSLIGFLPICVSSLKKHLFKSFVHFFNQDVCFVVVELLGVRYLFWLVIPYQISDFQVFSPNQ